MFGAVSLGANKFWKEVDKLSAKKMVDNNNMIRSQRS